VIVAEKLVSRSFLSNGAGCKKSMVGKKPVLEGGAGCSIPNERPHKGGVSLTELRVLVYYLPLIRLFIIFAFFSRDNCGLFNEEPASHSDR